MRSLFVAMHKPRVDSHVSGQYRRQPTFNPDCPLLHHGMQSIPQLTLRRIRGDCQRVLTGCPSKLMSVIVHETVMAAQHRMSVVEGNAEDIYSGWVFRILTQLGHWWWPGDARRAMELGDARSGSGSRS